MSEFNEFDQQGSVPNRDTGSIISHAFEMYKGIFLYAIVSMIIYVIADSILESIVGFNLWSFGENIRDSNGDFSNYRYHYSPGFSCIILFRSFRSSVVSDICRIDLYDQ
jgi:hypothetical protein